MKTEHTHTWNRSTRKHGRPGRFFVECDCGIVRQATIRHGHLHVFHTGVDRGGRSKVVSYRLKPWQERLLNGRAFVQFVDQAFADADKA